ncbi:MAG: insulinase family protein [Candidatus Aminicenantes bacterium]|nr:insulinase family protein [Candidatus Aminicenantes bacterium]
MSQKKAIKKTYILISFLLIIFSFELFPQPLNFEKLTGTALNTYYQYEADTSNTTMLIIFPGGQSLEPTFKPGLAYLTTRLMVELPDEEKIAQMEENGINLKAGTTPDYSFIQLDSLNSSLEIALKIVFQNLNQPLFSGLRIEAVKKIMAVEERKERTRLLSIGRLLLLRKIWPSSSFVHSAFGGKLALKNINKKDISTFYSYLMNPETISLAIISGLKKEKILDLIKKYFVNPKKDTSSFSTKIEKSIRPESPEVKYEGPHGAAILVGFVLKGDLHSIYPAAYVLEKIIGEGPGCLLWNLRHDRAYAYNVNSRLEIIGQKMILFAYLETEPELAETAHSDLLQVFLELYERGLSAEEIEKGKLLAHQSFFRESFNRDSRLHRLATFVTNNLPMEFFNSFFSNLLAVNQDSLNSLIKSSLQPEQAFSLVIKKN